MKRKISAAVSVMLIMCLMCSATAYAAKVDEDSKSTTLTYTKEEAPEVSTEPSLPIYEIAIPAELSLNDGNTLPLYLTANNMTSAQTLWVYLNGNQMEFENDLLLLHGTESQTPAKVQLGFYTSDGQRNFIGGAGLFPVAQFKWGSNNPSVNGTMFFEVTNDSELIADTYTGTVCFLLEVSE